LENVAHLLLALTLLAIALVTTLWIAGAIYFDVGRGRSFAWPLTLLWILAVVSAFLFWKPSWQPLLALLALFTLFLYWWFSLQPSNDRDWDPNFAVLPRFDIDGDQVRVQNVRDTEYRTLTDFTPRYETRNYRLSHLKSVDVAITFWGSPWLCHPMLSFDFGNEGRICISIEVRYRAGQRYGFFSSLYRQHEIMYVVSDERDAILKRSKYSENHDVYLYRVYAEAEKVSQVFLEYVVSVNELFDKPRWYHGLTSNCTTTVYRQRAQEVDWDWRWLFNGKLSEMLYDHGRLDKSLPMAELKQQSKVNEIANRAPHERFGDFIRRELPAYRHDPSDIAEIT